MRYVIIFTKFISQKQTFIVQIKILIQEVITKGLSYSIDIKGKFVNFKISDQKVPCVNLNLSNEI